MASFYNFYIDQGASFSANITAKDTTGSVRDITNFTPRSQLRRSYFSSNSISFTSNIFDTSSGNVSISLEPSVTANLKYGRYVYDIELVHNVTGNVHRLVEGIATVYPEVTK